jgi:hypothetical protein
MIDLPDGALDSANLRCECRYATHATEPCPRRGVAVVRRPAIRTFLFWRWRGTRRLRVCNSCWFSSDVEVKE